MISKKIKDFLYLDFERIRSFGAQIFNGVAESVTETSETNGVVKTNLKNKLNLFWLSDAELGGEAEINGKKITSQTKSLHHQLYVNFEEKIEEMDKVDIIKNSTIGDPTKSFVKIYCKVQLIDYTGIAKKMDILMKDVIPKVMSLSNKSDNISKEFKKQVKDIVSIINSSYGEAINLRVFIGDECTISTNLDREYLQYKNYGIISGLEQLSNHEWVVFGEVVKKQKSSKREYVQSNLSDILVSTMLPIYDYLNAFFQPDGELEIVPLAVYREL